MKPTPKQTRNLTVRSAHGTDESGNRVTGIYLESSGEPVEVIMPRRRKLVSRKEGTFFLGIIKTRQAATAALRKNLGPQAFCTARGIFAILEDFAQDNWDNGVITLNITQLGRETGLTSRHKLHGILKALQDADFLHQIPTGRGKPSEYLLNPHITWKGSSGAARVLAFEAFGALRNPEATLEHKTQAVQALYEHTKQNTIIN